MPRLVACPACNVHVKLDETACPHCGAELRDARGQIGRAASAMLMGLAISCGGDDGTNTSQADGSSSESASATDTSSSGSASMSDSSTETTNITTVDDVSESAYGEADLDASTTSDDDSTSTSGTDSTGTDSTGTDSAGEPDYGVPETG